MNAVLKHTLHTLDSLQIPVRSFFEICGIDEAGRGSLAGSLFVCGVILDSEIPRELLLSLKDSKVLSQKRRDLLSLEIKKFARFHLVEKQAQEIDKRGLSQCLKEALAEIVSSLFAPYYIFDGNCAFGIPQLRTLIKGDSKLPAISAASIWAKSAKDAQMQQLDMQYPEYGFSSHKGYGTKEHRLALLQHGVCKEHRKSYRLRDLHGASLF